MRNTGSTIRDAETGGGVADQNRTMMRAMAGRGDERRRRVCDRDLIRFVGNRAQIMMWLIQPLLFLDYW